MKRGDKVRITIKNSCKSSTIMCNLRESSPSTSWEMEKGSNILNPGNIAVFLLTAQNDIDYISARGEISSREINMDAYFELMYSATTCFSISGKKIDQLRASFSLEDFPALPGLKEYAVSFCEIG